jgi:hypothetical protein
VGDDYWKKYAKEQRLLDIKKPRKGGWVTTSPSEYDINRGNRAWRGKGSVGSRPGMLARSTPGEMNAAE